MSIKILLADDSITIQKVVGIIFGGDEYSLTVVDNGKAAVEKAQEVNPDILLIDALMPGMSGYEACEAVRAIPSLASKPIILLTGTFEKFDETKAKTCGADDTMAKPFESQQIIAKVKEMLELGKSRSSAPATAAPAAPEAASGDIWDAFSTEEPAQDKATTAVDTSSAFEMLQEMPELEKSAPSRDAKDESTGSKWIPAEEETFAFTDETSADMSSGAFAAPAEPAEEPMAFESTFESTYEIPDDDQPVAFESTFEIPADEPAMEEAEETVAFEPSFDEPVEEQAEETIAFESNLEEPAAFAPVTEKPSAAAAATAAVMTSAAAVPTEVSEDQLRAAIAGASREVIERIVWEIVPDLAETMIKEAIQKIRQGV